jgi:hypothetical protein
MFFFTLQFAISIDQHVLYTLPDSNIVHIEIIETLEGASRVKFGSAVMRGGGKLKSWMSTTQFLGYT